MIYREELINRVLILKELLRPFPNFGPSIIPPKEENFPTQELDRLTRRDWILSYAEKNAVGAEFGVFRGHFAVRMVRKLRPKKLFLVDLWTKGGETFGFLNDKNEEYYSLTTRQALEDCRFRLASLQVPEVVEIIEDDCIAFCAKLAKSGCKLDYVYLDAGHGYTETVTQLRAIDEVLADKGVIMGDDWDADPDFMYHEVWVAVHEFMTERRYRVVAAGPDRQFCIRRA